MKTDDFIEDLKALCKQYWGRQSYINYVLIIKPGTSKNYVALFANNPHVIGIGKTITEALETLSVSITGHDKLNK